MGRSVLAVLVGVVLAGIVTLVIEALGHLVFPPPEGMDPGDPESIRAFMDQLSVGSLLSVLVAWALGTVAGAWIASRIARRAHLTHGMIVGFLMLAGGIFNLATIPHPMWMTIAGVLLFLPSAYLGTRIAGRSAGTA